MLGTTERRTHPRTTPAHADVMVELTQLTFRDLLPVTAMGALGLVGATMIMAHHYHDPKLWWLGSVLLVCALGRLAVVICFGLRKDRSLTLRGAQRWQLVYASVTIVYSLIIAALTLYCFKFHDADVAGRRCAEPH